MSRSAGEDVHSRAGQLEIAHLWQAGDGAEMLAAVLDQFRSRHPDVGITDRGYANHGLAIKSRILKEDPPEVFVEWPGENMAPYLEAGALRMVNDVWEENDLERAFIDGPTDLVTFEGDYYGVPVDIHRMNNLFYNVELVEERGIDPASVDDPREFLEVLQQCGEGDVVGLQQPMKNPDTVIMLFTAILMGQFGSEVFEEIAGGDAREHESEIAEALELLEAYASLASDDASFLGMVEANQRFMDDESVFFYQGDWVAGGYDEKDGFDYKQEWDHVPFPGTDDIYRLGVDSVVASADPANEQAVETFLGYISSPEALETLNRMKGSIPPRGDVSMDRFPRFLRDQFEDFKRARHFPAGQSLEVPPDVFVEAKSAFTDFLVSRDVRRGAEAIVEAYERAD